MYCHFCYNRLSHLSVTQAKKNETPLNEEINKDLALTPRGYHNNL